MIGRVLSLSVERVPEVVREAFDAFSNYLKKIPLYKRAETLAETCSLIKKRDDDFAKNTITPPACAAFAVLVLFERPS